MGNFYFFNHDYIYSKYQNPENIKIYHFNGSDHTYGSVLFDIKFVMLDLNILRWDVVIPCVWFFARLHKWADYDTLFERMCAIVILGLLRLVFTAFPILLIMNLHGDLANYIERTEPQTQHTFVVEYKQNMLQRGYAKLYERFGPLIFPCDVEKYIGEFLTDEPRIYLSEDGKEIIVAYFFLQPVFSVPLESRPPA